MELVSSCINRFHLLPVKQAFSSRQHLVYCMLIKQRKQTTFVPFLTTGEFVLIGIRLSYIMHVECVGIMMLSKGAQQFVYGMASVCGFL